MFKGNCYTRQRRGFFITRFRQSFFPGFFCGQLFVLSDDLCTGSKYLLTVSRWASLYLNEGADLMYRLWTTQSVSRRHSGATCVYGPLL